MVIIVFLRFSLPFGRNVVVNIWIDELSQVISSHSRLPKEAALSLSILIRVNPKMGTLIVGILAAADSRNTCVLSFLNLPYYHKISACELF
jgi:hypothetical protein